MGPGPARGKFKVLEEPGGGFQNQAWGTERAGKGVRVGREEGQEEASRRRRPQCEHPRATSGNSNSGSRTAATIGTNNSS